MENKGDLIINKNRMRRLDSILSQLSNLADEAQSYGFQVTSDEILNAIEKIKSQEVK